MAKITEGVNETPYFNENDIRGDIDFESGYALASFLETHPRSLCGCTSDCASCINYAIALTDWETDETTTPVSLETPLRFL